MKQMIQPCATAVSPVVWLKDEATLRAYLAQRDHCLWLYDRARSQGYYGPAGGVQQDAATKGRRAGPPWVEASCGEPGTSP